jgi:outer membrane protein OmpA-like peptidoglycan-associated protein
MGIIDKTVETARGIKRAIVLARKPSNFRHLAEKETAIARQVFERSIPYSKVMISDGLGFEGRPFTMPDLGGRYVLHVGDGYYGMSSAHRPDDRALLIHELVHVWQGEHSRWRGSFVVESGWSQLCDGDAAYDYDPTKLKDWDSYNPEQQAQIVEGWYSAGMSQTDPRYAYIRCNIRGDCSIDLPPEPPLEATFTRFSSTANEEPRKIPCDVLFAFDSARLKPEARSYLAKVVPMLDTHGKGKTVVIEGHTDSVGSLAYNMKLSRERALAVKRALIELGADNAANFKIKAYGEGRPLVPNTSREGRQENRRVEFRYE